MKYASGSSCVQCCSSCTQPPPPVRVFAAAVRLLSMNIQRVLSALFLYVFPSLRLFFLSGFFSPPLSLSLSLSFSPIISISLPPSLSPSPSLSHCIHFCAFKKSPRITNLEESELTGVTEEEGYGLRKRKTNKDGTGQTSPLPSLPPSFLYSNMRVKPY